MVPEQLDFENHDVADPGAPNRRNDKVSGYRYSGNVLLGGRSRFNDRGLLEVIIGSTAG
jgi:hypothetical protein